MNLSRLGFGLLALVAVAASAAGVAQSGQPAPTVLAQATSAPTASPTPAPRPRRGRRAPASPSASSSASPTPSPTETPEPPQFTTLDGVWEVELQPLNGTKTIYSHLNLIQNGNELTGYWEHEPRNTRSLLTGTFDGRLFSLSINDAGTTYTMSGYAENFSDFVGVLKMSPTDLGTPFTAEHRKKMKIGV